MSDEILHAALRVAGYGWRVFPCLPRQKEPCFKNDLELASTDAEVIRKWWTEWPNANLAVALDNVVVLDVDGPEGEKSLRTLVEKNSPLPPTLESKTGRKDGGRQLFFTVWPGHGFKNNNTGHLGFHLDVKTDSGYVIVPPSVHPEGPQYTWITKIPPVPLPDWLVPLMPTQDEPEPSSPGTVTDPIPKGQRNSTLASLAGTMRRRGLTQAAIEAALLQTNRDRCQPPLAEHEVKCIAASVASYPPGAPSTTTPPAAQHTARLRSFATIPAKRLKWLWDKRLPKGKLALIIGDPGEGKGLAVIDLIRCITNGVPFPDGAPCLVGSVIWLDAEDDEEDTVRPRMDAAGVDVARVHSLTAVRVVLTNGQQTERDFSLVDDVDALEDAIRQVPDTSLVVISPISSYLGNTDSYKNAEVRGLLKPVAKLAGRTGVAIVGITHLRKTPGRAIHRSIDSIAFAAAARVVLGIAPDLDDRERKIMVRVKGNLSRDPGGLAYRIVEAASGVPRVVWESGIVNQPADDVMGGLESADDRSERVEAAEWLADYLAAGPRLVRDVIRDSKQVGLSWASVRRAKKSLEAKTGKCGFRDGWEWSLPRQAKPPETKPEEPGPSEGAPQPVTHFEEGEI
jgi:hypothetical protein